MVKLAIPASCNLFFKFSWLFSWRPWPGCDSQPKTITANSNTGKHNVFIVEPQSSTERNHGCQLQIVSHLFFTLPINLQCLTLTLVFCLVPAVFFVSSTLACLGLVGYTNLPDIYPMKYQYILKL